MKGSSHRNAGANTPERLDLLRGRLDGIDVAYDDETVAALSLDTYWKAHALAAAGRPIVAGAVARPRSASEVADIMRIASELGIEVTPRAGGSGSQGGAVPSQGGLVLDTSGLDSILELNEMSQTVRVESGVSGLELEHWLNERGFTFPHFPASVHLARVGGYLSAKGSGVLSTKYGKIEDLVASLEVVLPTGEIIRTVDVPRHAVGPDLNQLFIGSEGTLGVITEATLLVRELPEKRELRLFSFPDVRSAMDTMRGVIQRGWRPSIVRVHDASATESNLSRVLGVDVSGVVAVVGSEGLASQVKLELDEITKSVRGGGGSESEHEVAEAWWENRYKIYYPPYKPELPQIWGTADIVASYDRLLPAYEALRSFFESSFSEFDLWFGGHFSHWYPWGAMVYGRFVVRQPPRDIEDAVLLYDEIWRRSSQIALEHGALLNDHHGVGLKLSDHVAAQWGPAWSVVERIKKTLDPAWISNPGKLGL